MSQMRDKDLREFWGKLAKAVGAQELPDVVKQELLKSFEQDITAAIGTGELEDYLIKFARSIYRLHLAPRGSRRRVRKASGKGDQELVPEVGQYERLRADVLSEYLAKMAAINPEVVQFRSDVLAGELLTPEQARAFFSSPATRYLDRGIWQSYGISARHTATLVDENHGRTEDGSFHWVRVRTDPLSRSTRCSYLIPRVMTSSNTYPKMGDPRESRFGLAQYWASCECCAKS